MIIVLFRFVYLCICHTKLNKKVNICLSNIVKKQNKEKAEPKIKIILYSDTKTV